MLTTSMGTEIAQVEVLSVHQPPGQRTTVPAEIEILPLFGPELRRRRLAAGYTLGRFATVVHYSKSHLSKIENGVKIAGPDLARQCDAALGADGKLAELATVKQRDEPATATSEGIDTLADEVWDMALAPDGSIRFIPRRQVLIGGAVSVLGIGMSLNRRTAAADGEMTAELWSSFESTRRLSQRTAPAVVLPALIAQTHTARGLAAGASKATRSELFALSARCAELTSWMVQEAGDDTGTRWWLALTSRLAEAAGDTDLAGYTQVRLSEVALYQGDGRTAARLARRAATDPRLSGRVRGMASQREAQALSLLGNADGCHRALDRAGDFALVEASPAGGVLGSSTTPDLQALVAGWCLHDLGRPLEAADVLGRQMPYFSPSARRARARCGIRLALAYASAGEIEQACAVADEILPDAELVESATITADLRRLAATLRRWPKVAAVRETAPAISSALYAPAR